jgi:hypothetical protein
MSDEAITPASQMRKQTVRHAAAMLNQAKNFNSLILDPAEREQMRDTLGVIAHDLANVRQMFMDVPEMLPEPDQRESFVGIEQELADEFNDGAPEGAPFPPVMSEA